MKKERNRALPKLRLVLHKTQEELALMVGVSKDTIVSVENGRNRLTPDLAYRIFLATGIDRQCLLDNSEKLMAAGSDRQEPVEYTAETYDEWRREIYNGDFHDSDSRQRAAQLFFDYIKGRIEVLLIASTRPGVKGKDRFPAVLRSLEDWAEFVYRKYDLVKEVDDFLRETTCMVVPNRVSVGFLRDAAKNGNPIKFNFKDSKKYKDSDVIDVTSNFYETWDDGYLSPPVRKPFKFAPPVQPKQKS